MPDILLSHGYFLYEDEHEKQIMRPYPPLGILYISSHLKACGFNVEIFDSTFASPAEFEAYISTHRPEVVGLYANMLTRRMVLKMIAVCKSFGAKVIIGGPDPANYAERYLRHGADVIVIGEGEATLAELIPALKTDKLPNLEKIAGIVYLSENDQVYETMPRPYLQDLNVQPFPDREAIDLNAYIDTWRRHHGKGAVSLITARGCPYKCNWCSHAVFGYSHRRRSPENVVDEVAHIKATYNPELLWYADDVFTIQHRWLFQYAETLKERGLNTPFETISREDRLDEKVIATLADMGCYRLWIGAESGSQRILDAMERQTSVERVIEMVHLLKKYDIETGMFIMLGYDGETQDDLQATVDTLKSANPDIFLTTVAYPIAGTKYMQKVQNRVAPLKAWEDGSDADQTVIGRHSRRYYSFATRWMVGEVELNRQRKADTPDYRTLAKSFVNARIGRLGMALTQNQIEQGQT